MKHTLVIVALSLCLTPGIVKSQALSFPITFSTDSSTTTLIIGTHPDATDDFDMDIDVFAPPAPPANALSVWSTINNENYQEDYRDTTSVEKLFHISFQADPGSNITLIWDAAPLVGEGIFEITDDVTSDQFGPIDMTTTNSFDISSAGGLLDTGLRIRMAPDQESGVNTEQEATLPNTPTLEQNFPNPFAQNTEIQFTSTGTAKIKLAVFDVLGKEVAVLIDEVLAPGRHTVSWEPDGFPNGIYFYQLAQGTTLQTNRMILIQ